jgi:hypothetical protein
MNKEKDKEEIKEEEYLTDDLYMQYIAEGGEPI